MPPVEVNHIRHINASVRLDEFTTAQVDQYAAFIYTSADDVVDKALTCVFSKDCDFQYSPKTPQAKQLFLHCARVRGEQWRIGGARKEV